MSSAAPGPEVRDGTYLYAIVRDEGLECPAGLTGVAGKPVRTIVEAGLAAVVSTVPFPDFEEAALRRNLEDLRWLESTARAHHAVVNAIAGETTTAPVSLVTVYHDDRGIRRLLTERRDEIVAALDAVAGRSEWGVKVYLDQPAPAGRTEPAGQVDEPAAADRTGTSYLRRRREALRGRESAAEHAAAVAEDVSARLARRAVANRSYQPQDPRLSGRRERMVLNAAYLVDNEQAAEFQDAARSLDVPPAMVELTGPWAPYSFVTLALGQS